MIFREMSRKIKTTSRVAAEEAKKRKDQHEDSDEALVDGEDEVYVAPSRKARKVSIGDVPAAPAEPDAPRDIPTANQVIDGAEWAVPRRTAYCLARTFATTNQILLAQELAAKLQAMKLTQHTRAPITCVDNCISRPRTKHYRAPTAARLARCGQ